MFVPTVLGVLLGPDVAPGGRPTEIYASAVRLCAKDMTPLVGKLPDRLRPAGRLVARSACGDRIASECFRAMDTQDSASLVALQAQVHDLVECTPAARDEAYHLMADDLRAPAGRLARATTLLQSGRVDEAATLTTHGWSSRLGGRGTAPLASVGAFRAHTGCSCPGVLETGVCTCGAGG